jgi:hypothetical protein
MRSGWIIRIGGVVGATSISVTAKNNQQQAKANGEAEALQVANGTDYDLSSAVFSRDRERGVQFALGVQAGMIHVNDHSVDDTPTSPFGGEKSIRWRLDHS